MEQLHQNDAVVSHRILNYLFAGYQGEYMYFQVLKELRSPEISPDVLKTLDTTLRRISEWYHGIQSGDCLFSASWSKAETFEAKKALQFLEELRVITEKSSQTLRAIAGSDDWSDSKDKTRKAAAHIVRNGYATRFYSQGLLDIATLTGDQAEVEAATRTMRDGMQESERVTACVAILKQDGLIPESLIAEFFRDMNRSAGALAAQAHDILQILAVYNGGEQFIAKSFDQREISSWSAAGINMVQAGYWRAFGFGPEEAAAWAEQGISLPGVGMVWRLEKFSAVEAAQWVSAQVPVNVAAQWRDHGYELSESLVFIKKGFTTPDKLPQGQ